RRHGGMPAVPWPAPRPPDERPREAPVRSQVAADDGLQSRPAAVRPRLLSALGADSTLESGLQPHQPLIQLILFPPKDSLGLCQLDPGKSDAVSGPELAKLVQVGGDDLRDLWVASDRLAVHTQDDALPVASDLHAAGANGLRNHFCL